jgi:hypothetical protein
MSVPLASIFSHSSLLVEYFQISLNSLEEPLPPKIQISLFRTAPAVLHLIGGTRREREAVFRHSK